MIARIRQWTIGRGDALLEYIAKWLQNKVFNFYCHGAVLRTPHCEIEEKEQCEACRLHVKFVQRREK